jgi:hypothetical protein
LNGEHEYRDPNDSLPREAGIPLLHGPITPEEQIALDREWKIEAEKEADRAYKSRQLTVAESANKLTRANIRLTWVVVFFTAVTAGAAWYQGFVANKSAKAAKDAADASGSAAYSACLGAQISRGALIQEMQAGVDAHNSAVATTYQTMVASETEEASVVPNIKAFELIPNLPIEAVWEIKNEGKSVAKNIRGYARYVFIARDKDPDFNYPDELSADIVTPQLEAGQEPTNLLTNGGVPVKNDDGTIRVLNQDDLRDIKEGKMDLLFISRVTYDDSLGVHHWVNVCKNYPIVTSERGQRPVHERCIRYNQSDNNTVVTKPGKIPNQIPDIPEIACPVPSS